MTITCEFGLSIWVTAWRRNTIAAVVKPVGWNAVWSFNKDAVDGWLKAGYKNCRTIDCSMILVSTGVIDIGQKSVLDLAVATFGTGRITALFHWRGTTEEDRDRLNSLASCSLQTGAPSLRNQAGRLSKPVAVWCNLSNILNTCHSVMYWQSPCCWLTVCLYLGSR